MRSICFSLLCACDALLALARNRSVNNFSDSISFWFELPPAVLVENMERIVIGRVGTGINDPGYSCFMLLDDFLGMHKLRRNGDGKFEHSFVSGSGGFLRKKSDGCVLLDRDRSLIGRDIPEQRRK